MRRILILLLLTAGMLVPSIASAQIAPADLNACYQATIGKKTVSYSGTVWLTLVRNNANVALTPLQPLLPAKKLDAKRCTGAQEPRLKQSPELSAATSSYFGAATSVSGFRKLAELDCQGTHAQYPYQFFAIGSAVLYRDCENADGKNKKIGYIYFWGLDQQKSSTCFNSDYPTMYGIMTDNRPNKDKFTLDTLRLAETKGEIPKLDAPSLALANAVAAEVVAEAYRDVNLKYLNLMLLDIAKDQKLDLDVLLAGYCLVGADANECKNYASKKKGIHPMAWGGAQKVMTENGAWGYGAGANSDFGKRYEAGVIEQWLAVKQKGKPATSCTKTTPTSTSQEYLDVRDLLLSLTGQ